MVQGIPTNPLLFFLNKTTQPINNKMNFMRIFAGTLCITAVIIMGTSCGENNTVDSEDVAKRENIENQASDDKTILVVDNDNDATFLMKAAEIQMEEIRLGKLAQQKGNAAHVKELGAMMEKEHGKALTELKALVLSSSVSIPTTETEDSKDAYEKLNKESGDDFGKTYSNMMVEHHEEAIDLFEKASTDAKDPQIRTWAAGMLPGLRLHLAQAEICKEKCESMKY